MNYVVIIKSSCPFCIKTIDFLENQGANYKTIDIVDAQEKIITEIKSAFLWPTFPMIFSAEENKLTFIGGYTDLLSRERHSDVEE